MLNTWLRYTRRSGQKKPMWLSPYKVIGIQAEQTLAYTDPIDCWAGNYKLKAKENLPLKTDWFKYEQLKNLFDSDKGLYGFRGKNSELEEILLGNEQKLVSRVCKQLLVWHKEEEVVKNVMIKWAINCNVTIVLRILLV